MRLIAELDALKDWTKETVCKGKLFKSPGSDANVHNVVYTEPEVFVGYYPTRPDNTGFYSGSIVNTAPSILLMPDIIYEKNNEEQRFDRYAHISRPKQAGKLVNIQALFVVFEDGIRLPDYDPITDEKGNRAIDLTKIREGTHDGVGLLLNWMDEYAEALLGREMIPGTDMTLLENTLRYSMISDQKYVNDKRPLFYGLMEFGFQCLTWENQRENKDVLDILN